MWCMARGVELVFTARIGVLEGCSHGVKPGVGVGLDVIEASKLGVGFAELLAREDDADLLAALLVAEREFPHLAVGIARPEHDTTTLREELT